MRVLPAFLQSLFLQLLSLGIELISAVEKSLNPKKAEASNALQWANITLKAEESKKIKQAKASFSLYSKYVSIRPKVFSYLWHHQNLDASISSIVLHPFISVYILSYSDNLS